MPNEEFERAIQRLKDEDVALEQHHGDVFYRFLRSSKSFGWEFEAIVDGQETKIVGYNDLEYNMEHFGYGIVPIEDTPFGEDDD